MFAEKPVKGPEEEVVELLDGSREGKPEININFIKYFSPGTCFKAPERASAPNITTAPHHLQGYLHTVSSFYRCMILPQTEATRMNLCMFLLKLEVKAEKTTFWSLEGIEVLARKAKEENWEYKKKNNLSLEKSHAS